MPILHLLGRLGGVAIRRSADILGYMKCAHPQTHNDVAGDASENVCRQQLADLQGLQDVKDLLDELCLLCSVLQAEQILSVSAVSLERISHARQRTAAFTVLHK